MQFKKNIKGQINILDVLDPWASDPIYQILLQKDADSVCEAIYSLRDDFLNIDDIEKMDIYLKAFDLFKEFINECKKRDLFYD